MFKFIKIILKPFTIIPKIKSIFFIWFIFAVIFSNLGVILSIFCNSSIWTDHLNMGNLYLIAIAINASSISLMFIDIILDQSLKFKEYKIVSCALIILFMSVMAYMFSSVIKNRVNTPNIDYKQIILYVLSISLSIYVFCINYLYLDYDNYKDLEDSILQNILAKSGNTNNDGRGVSL